MEKLKTPLEYTLEDLSNEELRIMCHNMGISIGDQRLANTQGIKNYGAERKHSAKRRFIKVIIEKIKENNRLKSNNNEDVN